jgi:hypothetical protein
MDQDKFAYFLAKYRATGDEELREVVARVYELADEAADAVRKVATERAMQLPSALATAQSGSKELTAEERAKYTELSTSLWNGSVSKRVQYMFSAQALVFSFSLLGPQGLRVGALWLLLLAAPLSWGASRLGRQYTRSVCADAERSIEEKQKSLKTSALVLWPALLLSSAAGLTLAPALRGASANP